MKVQKGIFQNLKQELSTTQYDFKFETWSLGLFNCESKAHYFTPTNFKNLIMLKNEDSLMSVIKIDPSSPNSFQIVYHCKKSGRFGRCLGNTKKELCRLDEACQKSLIKMSKSLGAKTPEDYLKKIKIEIDKSKKKAIDQIMKKSGPGTSPQKIEQTNRIELTKIAKVLKLREKNFSKRVVSGEVVSRHLSLKMK